MFSTKRENHLYSRCVQFLFVLSGRELKEVVIFSFSTHADLHCTLTNIWIFVQSNLNTQINLVLKDKIYAVWGENTYAMLLFCSKQN